METLIKRSGLLIVSLLIAGSAHAFEADPNFANTQRICSCFEKTGTPNCQPLNATNTEEANRQTSSNSNGDAGNRH